MAPATTRTTPPPRSRPRVLLLLPNETYRAPALLEAARRLGADVTVGCETRNVLESGNPAGYVTVDFERPERSLKAVAAAGRDGLFAAVLGADDRTAAAAAVFAEGLGLPGNPPAAVRLSRDKFLMRESFARAGIPGPAYRLFDASDDPKTVAALVSFPCVLKPTSLSASQGVIRADDEASFTAAWRRVTAILGAKASAPRLLVEDFIPGREVALEGILETGKLRTLALFDKPDPLDGPHFEETIYVTPSNLPPALQRGVGGLAQRCARALGLVTGPVHAEFRINKNGVWPLELAARPIGGRCSKALRFAAGASLEELVLRQALGRGLGRAAAGPGAAGVMMIPIPAAGSLRGVGGLEAARAVAGITEIQITAPKGRRVAPPPEGGTYLGFIFARGRTPQNVEKSLRKAHAALSIDIVPVLAALRPKPEGGEDGNCLED